MAVERTSEDATEADDIIDLLDVPVVPGQSEPYVLPPGTLNCPLPQCPRHQFRWQAVHRVREHMRRKHGWPRPSEIHRLWDAAKRLSSKAIIEPEPELEPDPEPEQQPEPEPKSQSESEPQSEVELDPELEPAPATEAIPVDHTSGNAKSALGEPDEPEATTHVGTKRSLDGRVKRSTPLTRLVRQDAESQTAPTSPSVADHSPTRMIDLANLDRSNGIAVDRDTPHQSNSHLEETRRLHAAIPLTFKQQCKLRQSQGHPWTEEEDRLIFHLKDQIGLKWREIRPYFSYRGKSNVAQVRYSQLTRTGKVEQEDQRPSQHSLQPHVQSHLPPELQQRVISPSNPDSRFLQAHHHSSTRADSDSDITIPTVVKDKSSATRRSARTIHQPGAFSKYFHLRPQSDVDLVDQEEMWFDEVTSDKDHSDSDHLQVRCDDIEFIPRNLVSASSQQLAAEKARDSAAIGATLSKLARSPAQIHSHDARGIRHMKRRSHHVRKPYLERSVREFLHAVVDNDDWDAEVAKRWDGQQLHIDLTAVESRIIEQVLQESLPKATAARALSPTALAAGIDTLALRVMQKGHLLNRTLSSVRGFLLDHAQGQVQQSTVDRIVVRRERPTPSIAQVLRQRELAGSSLKAQHPTSYLLGPHRHFKGTSSDVNCVAWAPNGKYFAVGSAALTDESSMQYNRPNNLLFGDYDRNQLLELPNHATKRYAAQGPNATAAMSATQDPLLFCSISDVQFSSDSKVLFSTGYDRHLRLWEVGPYQREACTEIETSSNGIRCRWDLEKTGEVDLVAVAPCLPQSPGLFASAIKTVGRRKEPIKVYNYSLDATDVVEKLSEVGKLAPSRFAGFDDRNRLDPTCLRFCPSVGLSNRYLLGGFAARDDGERRGEACIWDVEASSLIAAISRRAIFDVQWCPSVFGRFAIGCGAHNANRGIQTVVRIYDSRWITANNCLTPGGHAKIELECPALDINDVTFNPNDPTLVATGCTDGVAYLWDLRNPSTILHRLGHGKPLHELDQGRSREEADTGVRFLSWTQSGRELVSGSSDGVVASWNPYMAPQNAFQHEIVRMDSGIMAGAFSVDHTSLLLGDVKGSVLTLTVGKADVSLGQCDEFEFLTDEPSKQRLRAPQDTASIANDDGDSGIQIGKQLLDSGHIELQPCGNFPRQQAVQGPNYTGPFSSATDADELRRAAATFQQEARARLAKSGSNGIQSGAQEQPVSGLHEDATVTDQQLWKSRIPEAMRETSLQQADNPSDTFSSGCSMCFGKHVSLRQDDPPGDSSAWHYLGDTVICQRCGATWRGDVLGYELVSKGVAKAQRTMRSLATGGEGNSHTSDSEPQLSDQGDVAGVNALQPVETLAHYHDLWHADPAVRSRS